MIRRTRLPVLAALASAALLAALTIGPSASARSTHAAATPVQGGDLVIARTQDSTKMDATSVFDNESIWVLEQMMETLYTVTPDGKDVKPWLATSYDLSPDKLTYTFHLRHGVLFHTGKEMTSADVKFSLDAARNTKDGWGYIDGAIKSVTAKDKYTVVVKTKFKWAPMVADIALFSNAIVPKGYDGKTKAEFYNAPVGTGPFKWDHWTKGKEVKLVKFDKYWQKGKPYLNSVTWTYVGDDNTRLLQLKGGQAQINEFPGWAQVKPLQNTAGVTMKLFPSTRTDYVLFNQHFKPFQDVHVRRAISYLIDRKALVKAILFGNGTPANSFLPPQVPYYDAETPGLTYNLQKAKEEMAKSSVPNGFTTTFEASRGLARPEHDRAGHPGRGQAARHQGEHPQEGRQRLERRLAERDIPRHEQLVLDDGHRGPGRARVVLRRSVAGSPLLPDLLQQPGDDRGGQGGRARVRPQEAPGALHEGAEARG